MLQVSLNHLEYNGISKNNEEFIPIGSNTLPSNGFGNSLDARFVFDKDDKASIHVNMNGDHRSVPRESQIQTHSNGFTNDQFSDHDITKERVKEDYKSTEYTPNKSDQLSSHVKDTYVDKNSRIQNLHVILDDQKTLDALQIEQPLLDDLVRHKVLTYQTSNTIAATKDQRKRKGLLLQALGLLPSPNDEESIEQSPTSSTGFALLLNALRATGNHALASQLDSDRKITPAPLVDSTQYSPDKANLDLQPRRRGQLTINLRLEAVKVNPSVIQRLVDAQAGSSVESSSATNLMPPPPPPPCDLPASNFQTPVKQKPPTKMPSSIMRSIRRPMTPWRHRKQSDSVWINGDDCQKQQKESHQSIKPPFQTQPPPLDGGDQRLDWSLDTEDETSSIGCWASCCFSRKLRSKMKKDKNKRRDLDSSIIKQPDPSAVHEALADEVERKRQASLMMAKIGFLDARSKEVSNLLIDQSSNLRDALVKYLEQKSSLLVLDLVESNTVGSLDIRVVATQRQMITKLTANCPSIEASMFSDDTRQRPPPTKLASDLTNVLIKGGLLRQLMKLEDSGVQDLRFSTWLNQSEVEQALGEL